MISASLGVRATHWYFIKAFQGILMCNQGLRTNSLEFGLLRRWEKSDRNEHETNGFRSCSSLVTKVQIHTDSVGKRALSSEPGLKPVSAIF